MPRSLQLVLLCYRLCVQHDLRRREEDASVVLEHLERLTLTPLGAEARQEVHLNFWYFNDALTLSQQAAATTSLLLSPSEVQQLRVTPEAKEIQTLMEMGLQN